MNRRPPFKHPAEDFWIAHREELRRLVQIPTVVLSSIRVQLAGWGFLVVRGLRTWEGN